jgi:hypothetical protein
MKHRYSYPIYFCHFLIFFKIARAEAQATAAQEMLQRCRKYYKMLLLDEFLCAHRDLEDSRRKEVRLRDKLREMLSSTGNNGCIISDY